MRGTVLHDFCFFVLQTGRSMRLLLPQLFGLDERRRYHKVANESVRFLVELWMHTDIVDMDRTALPWWVPKYFEDSETSRTRRDVLRSRLSRHACGLASRNSHGYYFAVNRHPCMGQCFLSQTGRYLLKFSFIQFTCGMRRYHGSMNRRLLCCKAVPSGRWRYVSAQESFEPSFRWYCWTSNDFHVFQDKSSMSTSRGNRAWL